MFTGDLLVVTCSDDGIGGLLTASLVRDTEMGAFATGVTISWN